MSKTEWLTSEDLKKVAPETEMLKACKRVMSACEDHVEASGRGMTNNVFALVNVSPNESAGNLALLGVKEGEAHLLEIYKTPNSFETAFVINPWRSEMAEPRLRVQRWFNVVLRQITDDRMSYGCIDHNLTTLELKALAEVLENGYVLDGCEEKKDLELSKNRGFLTSFRDVLKVPFGRRKSFMS